MILPNMQMAGYTYTCIHTWTNKVRVCWLCCCPGILWEPIQKQASMQLVTEHSATTVLAVWATVDWSWDKEWNWHAWANLHFKKKKKKAQAENEWSNILPKSLQARKKPSPPLTQVQWTDNLYYPLPSSPSIQRHFPFYFCSCYL